MRLHIATLNINVHPSSPIPGALVSTLAAAHDEPANDAQPVPAPIPAPRRIGEVWPGVAGVYAGLARGEDGAPDGHLVLLDDVPAADLDWPDAVKWAEDLGNGARLPTRFESALLYANVRDKLDTGPWHWTGSQFSEGSAWLQDFDNGYQHDSVKKFKARARAVRRFVA